MEWLKLCDVVFLRFERVVARTAPRSFRCLRLFLAHRTSEGTHRNALALPGLFAEVLVVALCPLGTRFAPSTSSVLPHTPLLLRPPGSDRVPPLHSQLADRHHSDAGLVAGGATLPNGARHGVAALLLRRGRGPRIAWRKGLVARQVEPRWSVGGLVRGWVGGWVV